LRRRGANAKSGGVAAWGPRLSSCAAVSAQHLPAEDLPTPGEAELRTAGLALGVAFGGELHEFRPSRREAELAAGMGERRRHDFLLGRLAARRALEALGVPAAPVLVAGRRPLFPRPVVGSISHSCGVGVALAGLREVVGCVGVDVELGRISPRAARAVCTADELDWAHAAGSETERAERATALFSAKESAYKTLPALAQHLVRWRDIVISPGTSGFTARVQGTSLGVRYPQIDGQWRFGAGVLTWATCGWP
jgi:enterobactin synthetase component D